jgi:hypothetical protein
MYHALPMKWKKSLLRFGLAMNSLAVLGCGLEYAPQGQDFKLGLHFSKNWPGRFLIFDFHQCISMQSIWGRWQKYQNLRQTLEIKSGQNQSFVQAQFDSYSHKKV